MTITHPRTLPINRIKHSTFVLDHGVVSARYGRGLRSAVSQIAQPVWRASFETPMLTSQDRETWRAWLATQRGGLNLFLAYDASRPNPTAYPSGHPATIAATWNGTATVTALSATQIAMSGLPANYIASAGDPIGLVQSGRYGYYTIVETVTMNGSGVGTVTVEPFVNPAFGAAIFTTSATAWLVKPQCLFMLDPRSVSFKSGIDATAFSFEADQVL